MKVKEIQRKMQELQEKYQIGLVAVTYQGICSCCAEPENFPKKWFLNKQQPATWKEVGSRIIFKNAHNGSGELKMNEEYTKKEQYISYADIDMETLYSFLHELIQFMKHCSGNVYRLEMPEDEYTCAMIVRVE